MMGKFHCKIAPYALADALMALENSKDKHRFIEYYVTKEDDDLIIGGKEKYFPNKSEPMCCADPNMNSSQS